MGSLQPQHRAGLTLGCADCVVVVVIVCSTADRSVQCWQAFLFMVPVTTAAHICCCSRDMLRERECASSGEGGLVRGVNTKRTASPANYCQAARQQADCDFQRQVLSISRASITNNSGKFALKRSAALHSMTITLHGSHHIAKLERHNGHHWQLP